MKVHLIDGTYELFRAHFGAPSARNAEGMEVGAARGLLRSMAALLRETDTTHVGFAFDTTIESFRNQLFDGYKTGEGMDPDLFAQFPLAERAARSLGMTVWSMIDFEADDALATAATRYAREADVDEVCICSPDKDLYQMLATPKVVIVDRMRKKTYDRAGSIEKFGVEPESIPDLLALVGDAADGIPGLPRWGAKSASTVLAHYRSIENIPESANDWQVKVRGAANLAQSLADRREDALLYKRLATLRTDVPLTETLEDVRWQGPRAEELKPLCDELGIDVPRL